MDATIGDPRATPSIERAFEGKALPAWWEQITLRAMVVSLVLGTLFCFIGMRIHLASGMVPAMNIPASLLGFFLLKSWTDLLQRCGVRTTPFTRQENIVVQTCVIACINLVFGGGFGSYILAMTDSVARSFDKKGEREELSNSVINNLPPLKWMAYLFFVGFVSLFPVIPLKKVMIIDYKLLYPTGTVTAHLINSFHTPQGAFAAKLQVSTLLKSLSGSFFWSFFQWFYTAGKDCGFHSFPSFGLEAYKHRVYFDFSTTFIGVGMLCPYMISLSLLTGSIISWVLLYPFLETKKGTWYQEDSQTNLDGISGYKVFIGIAIILGDGICHFGTLLVTTVQDFYDRNHHRDTEPTPYANAHFNKPPSLSYDDRRRTQVFLKDRIPTSFAVIAYILFAIISSVAIPHLFSQIRFYHIGALYIFAPICAFCNTYGTGLTDWSLGSNYGKIAIFVIASWVGEKNGGVIAGLAACGVMMATITIAAELMQDFRTAYLTLTSPRSMVASQMIGTLLGCVVNPIIFLVFTSTTKEIGTMDSQFSAPYATVYRGIALLSIRGTKVLPKYCIHFCVAFFFGAVAINSLRMVAERRNWALQHYIPNAMAMALPFFLGSYFTIDMCLGSLLLFSWTQVDKQGAELYATAVAAGLICGEGLWALPASLLSFFEVEPPICMKFLSREATGEVTAFLTRLAAAPN